MSDVPTNNNPTEAQVTQQKQQAGINSDGSSGAQTTKILREQKRMTVPPDFDFEVDPEPRPNIDPMNPPDARQQQNPQSPNPIDQMAAGIEIDFRGQKEMIPLDTARTMLQQFKNMSGMSPVIGVANQIAQSLGIRDPREVASLLQTAVMDHMTRQQSAAGPAPAAPASAEQQAAVTGQPQPVIPPDIPPQVDEQVDAFFAQNGLQPTPEMRDSMRMIMAYGKHIRDVARAFPELAADVKVFKDAQQINAQRALEDTINARAAKVAAELGIDTEQEVQGFAQWVQETAQTFPGLTNALRMHPDAMEKAIRQYHLVAAGQRALSMQQAKRTEVTNNLSRAGGDAPGGRPGGMSMAPKDDQKSFEADLMSRM